MASQQDLKRRIRSVRNTRKITKAMELVAGARLRRAEARIQAMRPYAERMRELMIGDCAGSGPDDEPPAAARGARGGRLRRHSRRDRRPGPGGPVQRAGAAARVRPRARVARRPARAWLVVGKKGRSTLTFRRYELARRWAGFTDRPAYSDAAAIANRVVELFVEREVDKVVMVYNRYLSPLTQVVETVELLPIPRTALEEDGAEVRRTRSLSRGTSIYEPEPEEILERLLPAYVETTIYRALLESAASELGARMTAMRNASKNANELIDRLTLEMNRARQAEITQEILEVVSRRRRARVRLGGPDRSGPYGLTGAGSRSGEGCDGSGSGRGSGSSRGTGSSIGSMTMVRRGSPISTPSPPPSSRASVDPPGVGAIAFCLQPRYSFPVMFEGPAT